MIARFLLALAASLAVLTAHATSVLPLYLDEIVDSAAVAFEGTVISNRTTRDEATGLVVTYTTFKVHEALKGTPGETYTITDYDAEPKPVQRPHPPIMIGGGGRATLGLAAREADIVGLAPRMLGGARGSDPQSITFAATAEKIAWVREAAGDRFDDLTLQVRVHVAAVTDDWRGMAELIGSGLGLDPEAALASPFAVAGDVERIVDTLLERRERWGFSEIGISASACDDLAPVVARLAGT